MRKVTVAAVQMRCTENAEENIARAEALVRKAAAEGAQIILLPELFERPYFCQERRYEYYGYAKPVEENDAVRHFSKVAKELSVVLPISFYERDKNRLFNTLAILDADGENLGIYRKTHIPDDHYYQEKFYFTPGDTGFKAFKTRYAVIGVGICWDQWFPETARFMAVKGAEILFYPTAIGSEGADPGGGQHAPLETVYAGPQRLQSDAGDRRQPGGPGDGGALCGKWKPEFFPPVLWLLLYHRRNGRTGNIHGPGFGGRDHRLLRSGRPGGGPPLLGIVPGPETGAV